MNTVTITNQEYLLYTWEDFGRDIFTLGQQITASNEQFDRIIALAKGGVTISKPILDLTAVPEMSSIQIEFYTGINETAGVPVITQSLPVKIKNERILILDDLADSGESLNLATLYIRQHGAKDVKTATLFSKPWSTHTPDFFVAKTSAWVIFPWEIRESIETLGAVWGKQQTSPEEIVDRLTTLGFAREHIEAFQRPA